MIRAGAIGQLSGESRPIWLAAGVFDGVHIGHQAVVQGAADNAGACGAAAWVLTFEPHPLAVLRPQHAPDRLTTAGEKADLFESLGLDGCLTLPFTDALAHREPEDFIADLVTGAAGRLAGLTVGPGWRFGHLARGDVELLRNLAAGYGVEVDVAEAQRVDDVRVSSSRIRFAIVEGRFEDAAAMLGRPYSLSGEVVRGKQAGRDFGYPTINVLPPDKALPRTGVYAARVRMEGALLEGAGYFGTDGTPGRNSPIEVHLFDFDRDVYGRQATIEFLHFVRGDRRFESKEALVAQIETDVAGIRAWFALRP